VYISVHYARTGAFRQMLGVCYDTRMLEKVEKKSRAVYESALQHQHRVGFVSFLCGFLFDILTLHRIDRLYEQVSFGVYMTVGTVLLVWISLRERTVDGSTSVGSIEASVERNTTLLTVLQFVYGGLAGGFLVLYGRSGTFEGSSFFISGLALLLLGNELLRARYRAVLFRFTIWFVLLCAYTTLLLPLAYGRLGMDVFVHGLLTAAIVGFGVLIFFRYKNVLHRAVDFYFGIFGSVLVLALFWVSYYTHSIPPVPLSLQSAYIAHSVVRDGDVYTVQYEKNTTPLLSLVTEASKQFVTQVGGEDGARLYCFSQIYAPAKLSSPLQHRWQVLDEDGKAWSPVATIPFSITGGRADGYRAYSYITLRGDAVNGSYGTYRCTIETEEGFLVGRRQVEVVWGEPVLATKTY
jgi:hypothetical protein